LQQLLNYRGRANLSTQLKKCGFQHWHQHLQINNSSEEGVTLLECLVAISVIAILGAMIGPPIVFTAATRLQNQRAEQAFQIAQAEVDRIRTLVTRGQHSSDVLPAVVASLNQAPIPTAISSQLKTNVQCPDPAYTGQNVDTNQLVKVDIDGDCDADFLMQVFRTDTGIRLPNDANDRPIDFSIGIRVYSARAEDDIANGNGLSARPANLRFTSGPGDFNLNEGKTGPLAVFDSDLIWSDRSEALCLYRDNQQC
jgi:prepilin-type N-terminal cleavage/methylation domain-containing protein